MTATPARTPGGGGGTASSRRDRAEAAAWIAAGVVLAALSLHSLFADVWREPLDLFVPAPARVAADRAERGGPGPLDLMQADLRFNVWGTQHGARALLQHPWRPFAAAPCFPEPAPLAYGHPLLTFGLLGAPVWAVSGDPVLTYNAVVALLPLLAAAAMTALVWDWTRRPAAAVAAGLIYGFGAEKVALANWPFITDTAWAVWALLFARRFLERGRLRDGLLAAGACALQLGVSFYPVLATAFLAPPLLVWMVRAHGVGALRPGPTAAAVGLLAAAAVLLFAPYLEVRAAHHTLQSHTQAFAPWSALVPRTSARWLAVGLAAAALGLRPRSGLGRFRVQPRWALVVGIALVAWLATDGGAAAGRAAHLAGREPGWRLPALYSALAGWIPGLATIRLPLHAAGGIHLALSLLAGLGAAELLARVPPRWRAAAGAVLVLVVAVDAVRPRALGLDPRVHYGPSRVAPPVAALRFFAELAARGNRGPLLEVPLDRDQAGYTVGDASLQTLLASYHGRRTSACYNSYPPPSQALLGEISRGLPAPEAVARARSLGFTTIVVHHRTAGRRTDAYRAAFARAVGAGTTPLRLVYADASRTAYAILPGPSPPGPR